MVVTDRERDDLIAELEETAVNVAAADGFLASSRVLLAGLLAEAATALTSPPVTPAAPAPALCGKPHDRDTCDRPARHRGDCSWQAAVIRGRAREYEVSARHLVDVARRLRTTEGLLASQTARYAVLRAWADSRPWWQRKPPSV